MDITSKFSKNSERNARTIRDAKTYLSQRYELLKLELLEKSSQLLSVIFSMVIVLVCALVVLVYLSSALVSWLTVAVGAAWAYTIVCGFFVAILVLTLAFKDKLFVKPLIRKFSTILYKNTDETEDDELMVVDEKGGSDE